MERKMIDSFKKGSENFENKVQTRNIPQQYLQNYHGLSKSFSYTLTHSLNHSL